MKNDFARALLGLSLLTAPLLGGAGGSPQLGVLVCALTIKLNSCYLVEVLRRQANREQQKKR